MLLVKILKIKFINSLLQKIVSIFILSKRKRRKIRQAIADYPSSKIIKEIEQKYSDYWIFCLFLPLGDTGITCSLLKAFKEANGGKILVLSKRKNNLDIAKLFSSIDKYIIIPKDVEEYIDRNPAIELQKGKYFHLNHWKFWNAPVYKSKNFLDLYKNMLGLDNDVVPEKIIIPSEIIDKVQHFRQKMGIENKKIILIIPDANSFNDEEFDNYFWIKLADELTHLGYVVFFNTKKNKYKKYQNIFLPMIEQLYFASLCSYVIGIRSGFYDLLALLDKTNMIALYPQNMFFKPLTQHLHLTEMNRIFYMDKTISFAENMLKICSLKMFKQNSSKELIYARDNELFINKVINEIKCPEKI